MRITKRIQGGSYKVSRFFGDVDAAQRGLPVLAKRLARRALTRTVFNLIRNGTRR